MKMNVYLVSPNYILHMSIAFSTVFKHVIFKEKQY
jgi:hypothetical protein